MPQGTSAIRDKCHEGKGLGTHLIARRRSQICPLYAILLYKTSSKKSAFSPSPSPLLMDAHMVCPVPGCRHGSYKNYRRSHDPMPYAVKVSVRSDWVGGQRVFGIDKPMPHWSSQQSVKHRLKWRSHPLEAHPEHATTIIRGSWIARRRGQRVMRGHLSVKERNASLAESV